jgi:hypothetical protein
MALKNTITLFSISLLSLSAFSQSQKYAEDSVIAQQLIANKLKSLETGVVNFVYLFSDAGSIVILYDVGGKIKGTKCYYKGKRSSAFKNLKLSKEDKLNFDKCMGMTSKDTTIRFSNCNTVVHSFNRVVFAANKGQHFIRGNFTSDCAGMLDKSGMYELYSIYKRLLNF